MKILFVGSTQGTNCSLHYFTALSRLGHQVLPFDPEYFLGRNALEKWKIRWNRGPTPQKRKEVSEAIIRLCQYNRFDAIFVMAENFLGWETMEEIRRGIFPPRFLYHSHDNNFSKGICKPKDFEKTLTSYDCVFTTKSQNVARYRELGQEHAFFIPSAYEPTVHHPVPDSYSRCTTLDLQVSFVGTYDSSRDIPLETVGWNRMRVWGNDWHRYPRYREFKSRITNHAIYYFELADVLFHSRIALGLLREEAEDRHTQRTFEIPACGAFQITSRNDEIQSFFKENEEVVLYQGVGELNEKVSYYLSHDSERERIARRGYERCLKDPNTYIDRVASMIQLILPKQHQVPFSSLSATVAR